MGRRLDYQEDYIKRSITLGGMHVRGGSQKQQSRGDTDPSRSSRHSKINFNLLIIFQIVCSAVPQEKVGPRGIIGPNLRGCNSPTCTLSQNGSGAVCVLRFGSTKGWEGGGGWGRRNIQRETGISFSGQTTFLKPVLVDRQTGRPVDRQKGRPAERETGRPADR